jgi:hypothetical protein
MESSYKIGSCHTCAMKDTYLCIHPKRAAKNPEIGCTSWTKQLWLPLDGGVDKKEPSRYSNP